MDRGEISLSRTVRHYLSCKFFNCVGQNYARRLWPGFGNIDDLLVASDWQYLLVYFHFGLGKGAWTVSRLLASKGFGRLSAYSIKSYRISCLEYNQCGLLDSVDKVPQLFTNRNLRKFSRALGGVQTRLLKQKSATYDLLGLPATIFVREAMANRGYDVVVDVDEGVRQCSISFLKVEC